MAELVECARLEIAYTGNCIEGSNPSVSAINNIIFAYGGILMETLVQIAKRLGIKPNPNMTDKEFFDIDNQIRQELRRMAPKSKISDNTGVNYCSENELHDVLYQLYKYDFVEQSEKFNRILFNLNLDIFKKCPTKDGIKSFPQTSYSNNDVFWFHDATTKEVKKFEGRFQIALKMDHPSLPTVFKKLDDFILKYKSQYKISLEANRSDSLNMYMSITITPQIAKEFFEIVKEVLQDKNHILLAGYPITNNGKEIQGIKFAPEPHSGFGEDEGYSITERSEYFGRLFTSSRKMRTLLVRATQLQSVGQLDAGIQECDLLYYLIGHEGENPIQIGNPLGIPDKVYRTSLDISVPNEKQPITHQSRIILSTEQSR